MTIAFYYLMEQRGVRPLQRKFIPSKRRFLHKVENPPFIPRKDDHVRIPIYDGALAGFNYGKVTSVTYNVIRDEVEIEVTE